MNEKIKKGNKSSRVINLKIIEIIEKILMKR